MRSAAQSVELLDDRSIGVNLLSQALGTNRAIGRYVSLCQLFENAFADRFSKLTAPLALFLLGSGLGYTDSEVDAWVRIRGSAAHGDLQRAKQVADEIAVNKFIFRMQQAAYDVLMNKQNWHDAATTRRDRWIPTTATSDQQGSLRMVSGFETNVQLRWYDPYTGWPIAMDAKVLPSLNEAVMPTVAAQVQMRVELVANQPMA